MSAAFISYVRENSVQVDYLKEILEANGVEVWVDRDRLLPGTRWKSAIERAIREGMYFISIHSKEREQRGRSQVNEELVVAIDELRLRPSNSTWFIAVRLDDSPIENRDIGGGQKLLDLNYCDLFNWPAGLKGLLAALGVKHPVFDPRKPLAAGVAPEVEITDGFVRYDKMPGAPEIWQGMEHRIAHGWCMRNASGQIAAHAKLAAPIAGIQAANSFLGTTEFDFQVIGDEISTDPVSPSMIIYDKEVTMPKGMRVPDLQGGRFVAMPRSLRLETSFRGKCFIENGKVKGTFFSDIRSLDRVMQMTMRQEGIFELSFKAKLPESLSNAQKR